VILSPFNTTNTDMRTTTNIKLQGLWEIIMQSCSSKYGRGSLYTTLFLHTQRGYFWIQTHPTSHQGATLLLCQGSPLKNYYHCLVWRPMKNNFTYTSKCACTHLFDTCIEISVFPTFHQIQLYILALGSTTKRSWVHEFKY